jgi:hypothetical protein
MGMVDRLIRILIAIVIAILYFTGIIGGVVAIILGIVAVIFLITGIVARCPGYEPMKISTRKKASDPPSHQ